MGDGKLDGAKQGLQTMLFYYLLELMSKVEDPKQYIATEICKMINLSEEQTTYVQTTVATKNKVIDCLSSSISLLENMNKSNKLDKEAIEIALNLLQSLKKECVNSIKKYTEIDLENE